MMLRAIIIFLLLAATAHAATQTVYVWLGWSGDATELQVQRQTTDGAYTTIATIGSKDNPYRDVISNDPGNTTYCYRLVVPATARITGEKCVTSPAFMVPNAPINLFVK